MDVALLRNLLLKKYLRITHILNHRIEKYKYDG